ncbi:hypothetical protein [Marinobacter zhanjiangensis]|uniref:KAP family P-loop domain-containing protein n=1 Tax=Marinobacter zhanjiangensis TaxID=578215 RepID=A0ABQ3AM82_9GAMM|nr:hypothetical protein [Marinobacter zhanjiangensis]GGY61183.1 hypothetical protein GCM10007071_04970 [Marinobacter zhanjiangensis]
MTIEIIKNQIDKFLASEVPGVLAIKGEWGVGKTFTWNKYLVEARNENRISLKKYSYISLFGINSLDVFKYSIFENVIDRNLIGTEANVDTFKRNSADLLASLGRKTVKLVKGSSLLKDFAPAIESFSFLSLEKHLICIDDLERKGKNLSIKDVMGLASLLKEQKKCQVVILLNDGEEGLEDYEKYREKVIDIELAFAPEPKECADIAYSDGTPYQDRLKELTTSLGIRNIRILKKIERLVKLALPLVEEFEPEISDQIIHSTVLFSWSYYCSESQDNIPPLDFITKKGYALLGIGDDKIGDQEKKWQTNLQAYNYHLTDELDLLIAAAVRTGFYIENEIKDKAASKNQQVIASKSEGSFSEAWRLYHDTFNDNAAEVIDRLYRSFKENCSYITLVNLNGTVSLFRELGEDKRASEIIEVYIDNRRDEPELFNLEKSDVFGDLRDQEIVDRFDKVYKESIKSESVDDVLERISHTKSWNQRDLVVLSNTSVDEYFELFKRTSGRRLSMFVTTCLRFGQFSNANEKQMEIADRATAALRIIASESEINKRRVMKFGVSLED